MPRAALARRLSGAEHLRRRDGQRTLDVTPYGAAVPAQDLGIDLPR